MGNSTWRLPKWSALDMPLGFRYSRGDSATVSLVTGIALDLTGETDQDDRMASEGSTSGGEGVGVSLENLMDHLDLKDEELDDAVIGVEEAK